MDAYFLTFKNVNRRSWLINKPILHIHTQYNRNLPFDTTDMNFMNLNHSGHGDIEHRYIYSRMRKRRKVVVGYWKDESTISQINTWIKAAIGYYVLK